MLPLVENVMQFAYWLSELVHVTQRLTAGKHHHSSFNINLQEAAPKVTHIMVEVYWEETSND